MATTHLDIGALMPKCTNMQPYAKAMRTVLKMPVSDVVTLVRRIHESLER